MLTKLVARNFKKFDEIEVEFGDVVVFIGPNNGGKTSALQALLLWAAGLSVWSSERKAKAEKRPGVTVPRLGLTQVPVSDAKHLWQNLRVRNVHRDAEGHQKTDNVLIDVLVSGETANKPWVCGLEFDYANPESFYCRPMRVEGGRMEVPEAAKHERVNLLPPLSGILTDEPELQPGRVSVLLGEGRSGEVLRNLCLTAFERDAASWERVQKVAKEVFDVSVLTPKRDAARGVITLNYKENGVEYPITSSGSGLKQVLLLFSYLESNPGSTLLLDEPDAHLEVLKQRQVYSVLSDAVRASGSQLIIASHSEVVMQEALDRDVLIGFVGKKPRRMDDRGSQVGKALKEIKAEDYYQAERKGFVIYLEGSTDLAILRKFAQILGHPVLSLLNEPFVQYVANQPNKAASHFRGLEFATPHLKPFAIFDRLEKGLPGGFAMNSWMWSRREIENYLVLPDVLLRYASDGDQSDLLERAQIQKNRAAMEETIVEITSAFETLGRDPWSDNEKVSDDVLPRIFQIYFKKIGLADRMSKTDYHVLVDYIEKHEVNPEIVSALDELFKACAQA